MTDRPATLEEMIRLTACLAVSFRWPTALTDEEFWEAAERNVDRYTPFVRKQYPKDEEPTNEQ